MLGRLAICCTVAMTLALASAVQAADPPIADWTSVSSSTANGFVFGQPVTMTGNFRPDTSGSITDGSFHLFGLQWFSPRPPDSDMLVLGSGPGSGSGIPFTLQFSSPVKDPVLSFASLASKLTFPPGTTIEELADDGNVTVTGNEVKGIALDPPKPDGTNDSNGSVRLVGTFDSVTFTAFPNFLDGNTPEDIYFQFGGFPPVVAPPPPPPEQPPTPPAEPDPLTGITVPPGEPSPGDANVATAQVDPSVAKLEWDVNGDGKTDATCPGDQPQISYQPATLGVASSVKARASGFEVLTVKATTLGGGISAKTINVNSAPPPPSLGVPPKTYKLIQDNKTYNPVYICRKPSPIDNGSLGRDISGRDVFSEIRRKENLCVQITIETNQVRAMGCFRPIEKIEDVPLAERQTVIDGLEDKLKVEGKNPTAADKALELTNGVISRGPVLVNGVKLTPNEGGAIVLHKEIDKIITDKAKIAVGGIKFDNENGFQIDTTKLERLALPYLKRAADGLKSLGGFGIDGDVKVTIVGGKGLDAHADVDATLLLPKWLGGGPVNVTARVDSDGNFKLNGLKIGPLNYKFGGIGINNLLITYGDGIWKGQVSICLPGPEPKKPGICIDAAPRPGVFPEGGVQYGPGDAFRVFANITFPGRGLALYPEVYLNRIGAGLATPPLRLLGGAQVTLAGLYELDGALAFAFPSDSEPWTLQQDRNSLGNNFPAESYPVQRTTFTLAASADGFFLIPGINKKIRLGGGYFLYQYPGIVQFGGGVDAEFGGVIHIIGTTRGDFNLEKGKFNMFGAAQSCLADIPLLGDICWGSTVDISSKGAGGCVDLGLVSVGGGVIYDPFEIKLWPLDGCKWSVYREDAVFSRRARAAQTTPVTVKTKAQDRSQAIELQGKDGAPKVHVVTADGKTLDSSQGSGFEMNSSIRILRSEKLKLTVIGLVDPKPGTHTITLLPGSPAISRVRKAVDQPAAKIAGQVTGEGPRRTLTYEIGARSAQAVTFFEKGKDGSREIGSTTKSGKGSLTFSPAPGNGTRTIEAQFTLDGLAAERIKVATFKPPPTRLPRPGRITVKRTGTTVKVNWPRVPEAATYEVLVQPSAGKAVRLNVARNAATVKQVFAWTPVRVTLQAIAPGRTSVKRTATSKGRGTRPRGALRPLDKARAKPK